MEELYLDDGATRIFFNTRGTNDDEVPPELLELLHYIENTTQMEGTESENEKIRRIQMQVNKIKASERMGVRYMQKWEELAEEREEGRKEGHLEEKRNSILELLEEFGVISQEVYDAVMKETDMDVLKVWLKFAARAESLEEFVENIKK